MRVEYPNVASNASLTY